MLFKELLKAAAEGDEQALGALYRMYQPLITKMSMLNNEFDDDLHQEQMICVCCNTLIISEMFHKTKTLDSACKVCGILIAQNDLACELAVLRKQNIS